MAASITLDIEVGIEKKDKNEHVEKAEKERSKLRTHYTVSAGEHLMAPSHPACMMNSSVSTE